MTTSNSRTSRGGRGGDVENDLDDGDGIVGGGNDDRASRLLSAAARSLPRPALSADARLDEQSLLSAIVEGRKEDSALPPSLTKARERD